MLRLPPLNTFFGEYGDSEYVRCRCCNVEQISSKAWFCMDCYQKLRKAEEVLKGEIGNLEAKNCFLSSWIVNEQDDSSGDSPFADILLVAADDFPDGNPSKTVPAHRFILASRSKVFRAMLEAEMAESRTGMITIKDVSHDVLQAFVKYLYTAEASMDDQIALKLLEMAEKYEGVPLKADCEKFLVSKINWDNSISLCTFAHQQNAKDLLKAASSFIVDNLDALENHPQWPEFYRSHSALALEVYRAHIVKNRATAAREDTSSQH